MNVKKLWQWQRPINAAQALTPEGITQNFVRTTLGSTVVLLGTLAWLLPSSIAAPPPVQAPTVSAVVPPAIAALVKNWDAAASRKDLDSTMKFYSPSFTHAVGF